MSERDWAEEKRTVLGRPFDAAFGRREATEEEMGGTGRPVSTRSGLV